MDGAAAPCVPWESLPAELVLAIAKLLKTESRLALAAVCSSYREALSSTSCWLDIDLSCAEGATPKETARSSEALLRAANRRARGRLVCLNLTNCTSISQRATEAVCWANHESLTSLVLAGAGTAPDQQWPNKDAIQRLLSRVGEQCVLTASPFVWLPHEDYTMPLLELCAAGRLKPLAFDMVGNVTLAEDRYVATTAVLRTLEGRPGTGVSFSNLHVRRATEATREELEATLGRLSLASFISSNCGWTPSVFPQLCAAALHGNLTKLAFSTEAGLISTREGMERLGALLAACAPQLKELSLTNLLARGVGAGKLMRTVLRAPLGKLQSLILAAEGSVGNGIGPQRVKKAAAVNESESRGGYSDDSSDADRPERAPPPPPPPSVTDIDEKGVRALLSSFLQASPELHTLHLPWLGAVTLEPLFKSLGVYRSKLKQVWLLARDVSEPWLAQCVLPALQSVRNQRRKLLFRMNPEADGDFSEPLRSLPSFYSYSDLLERCDREDSEERQDKAAKPWSDWEAVPAPPREEEIPDSPPREYARDEDGDWMPVAHDPAVYEAHKKMKRLVERKRELVWRTALRPPPTPQRPWQEGITFNLPALPVDVLRSILRHLRPSSRIALWGVCRAWRASLMRMERWGNLTFPQEGPDARFLRQLASHFDFVARFDAFHVSADVLSFDDVAFFLWCTPQKPYYYYRSMRSYCGNDSHIFLPKPDDDSEVEISEVLRLGRTVHAHSLHSHNGEETDAKWTRRTFLASMTSFCKCYTPAGWRTLPAEPGGLSVKDITVHWLAPCPEPRIGWGSTPEKEEPPFQDVIEAAQRIGRAVLRSFTVSNCRLTRHFMPAITGLLRNGLERLELSEAPQLLKRSRSDVESAVALFASAIRSAPKLASLSLHDVGARMQGDVAALLDACVGHATLSFLSISLNSHDEGEDDAEAAALVGAALARLVEAQRVPMLKIDCRSRVTSAQSAPLWEALQRRALAGGDSAARRTTVYSQGRGVADQAQLDAWQAHDDEADAA